MFNITCASCDGVKSASLEVLRSIFNLHPPCDDLAEEIHQTLVRVDIIHLPEVTVLYALGEDVPLTVHMARDDLTVVVIDFLTRGTEPSLRCIVC